MGLDKGIHQRIYFRFSHRMWIEICKQIKNVVANFVVLYLYIRCTLSNVHCTFIDIYIYIYVHYFKHICIRYFSVMLCNSFLNWSYTYIRNTCMYFVHFFASSQNIQFLFANTYINYFIIEGLYVFEFPTSFSPLNLRMTHPWQPSDYSPLTMTHRHDNLTKYPDN